MAIVLVDLEGTPLEMGRQHGELLAEGARAMCESRIDLCRAARRDLSRRDLLGVASKCLPALADFAPATYAEFQGIAQGAGLPEAELLIGNGYTDFADLVRVQPPPSSECTAFEVSAAASRGGRSYLGQTWDMNGTAFPHVIALRRLPDDGPASVTMTTAGCLSLVGINECGVAIGNTNLVPRDARAGVMYLSVIHAALAQASFENAVDVVTNAPRMSGHFYYLGGPNGELVGIETTAARHAVLHPDADGVLAHANHYVDGGLADYVGQGEPAGNSPAREARMWELLRTQSGEHDLVTLAGALSDHEVPICRHERPDDEARTCSAAIMCPSERAIRMARGYPCEEEMVEVRL